MIHFLTRQVIDQNMAEMNDNEPVKITEKLRSEITEVPIEYDVVEPEEVVEPEDEEERFEETIDTDKTAEESKPQREKTTKEKKKRPATIEPQVRSVSKLQDELRKHSDARKKTDLAILDIRKVLKDLLLVHHATIKDLQKQVTQMHRKIATIESKKSTRSKTSAKKTTSSKKTSHNKKTTSSKKSKKKSGQKKSRKH